MIIKAIFLPTPWEMLKKHFLIEWCYFNIYKLDYVILIFLYVFILLLLLYYIYIFFIVGKIIIYNKKEKIVVILETEKGGITRAVLVTVLCLKNIIEFYIMFKILGIRHLNPSY